MVPVGIVLFRYFMVCHAVSCHNHGGDRTIFRGVMVSLVLIALSTGVTLGFYTQSSLTFLLCVGKEERFRWDVLTFVAHPSTPAKSAKDRALERVVCF